MSILDTERLETFAHSPGTVPEDLERSLTLCRTISDDPILCQGQLRECGARSDWSLSDALVECVKLETFTDRPAFLVHEPPPELPEALRRKWLTRIETLVANDPQATIRIDGLDSLSESAFRALAKCEKDLDLGRLTTLSASAARALSRRRGPLNVSGFEDLTDWDAQCLAEHQGDLDLSGLKSLSDVAAEAPARHQGRLFLAATIRLLPGQLELFKNSTEDFRTEAVTFCFATTGRTD